MPGPTKKPTTSDDAEISFSLRIPASEANEIVEALNTLMKTGGVFSRKTSGALPRKKRQAITKFFHVLKNDAGCFTVKKVKKPKIHSQEDIAVPWREVYPDFKPGIALRGARVKEGLTQIELADLTGVPQPNISDIENNKRTIGKELAKKFGKVLNVDYRVFL